MANIVYDIPTLLTLAYGTTGLALYNVQPVSNSGAEITYSGFDVITSNQDINTLSAVGTPIVFPWHLVAGKYKSYDDKGNVIELEFANSFEMPRATICDFSRGKIRRRTKTSGSRGTVKEMYGWEDWKINIRGVLFNDFSHTFKTAHEQKRELLRWENVGESVEVSGELFTHKGIYRIDIDEIKFSQLSGKPDLIPYEISAYSDTPIELYK
jgi:hypothetical protein